MTIYGQHSIEQRENNYKQFSRAPHVGIFWLLPDKSDFFYYSAIPVAEGIDYGDLVISKDDHYPEWEKLRDNNMLVSLPKFYQEYDSLPRGRISYDKTTDSYVVLCGNWITDKIKNMILSKFRLPKNKVKFEQDLHYNL